MIYLHKLFPLMISPLGVVSFLICLSIIIRSKILIMTSLFVLLICSLPITAHHIWKSLESTYPYENMNNVGRRDAVVVLSGILQLHNYQEGNLVEWGEAVDRFFAGVELVKLGKANKLIFTKGQMPWNESSSEGEILKQKAIKMGLDNSHVLLTGAAANTSEEAKQVKKLLSDYGLKSIILVTSSFHMPRAKIIFDREGIDSLAYAVDYRTREMNWLDFVPSAEGFFITSSGIREFIGRFYYSIKLNFLN